MAVDIVSVHVPKTAGYTFKKIFLEEVYRSEELFWDYSFDYSLNSDKKIDVINIDPRVKVIHGHFSAIKYKNLFPNAKSIIWLREPITRLISHYFYWLGQEKFKDDPHGYHAKFIEERPSFLEFCHYPYTRNAVSKFYIQDLDLTDFFFIGIQDFFQDDIKILANFLDVKVPTSLNFSQRYNDTKYPRYIEAKKKILSQKNIIKKVKELNHDDIDMYEKALDLRNRRTH